MAEPTRPDDATRFGDKRFEGILTSIDIEILNMATLCKVRLFDPGVAEKVIDNNDSVCGTNNPSAFKKLRGLLIMHFSTLDQAKHQLGADAAAEVAARVREHLKPRIGDRLGTRP